MKSILDQLRDMSTIVADTGDLDAVRRLAPVDCTTNPSLVLGALNDPASEQFIAFEVAKARAQSLNPEAIAATLTVAIGAELAKLIPGRVSTEVDTHLSFDVEGSVFRAKEIIEDYAERGIGRDRILIKLAATWEGIRAAERLQFDGIDCNLTLVFSLAQAIACADAGVFLISPFVGRITDWHKRAQGVNGFEPEDDPGVQSVRAIFDYYKSNDIATVVMGASFRTTMQIRALAGCDRLTISPKLLDELCGQDGTLLRSLSADRVPDIAPLAIDEFAFRWRMNEDAMATEKLAEGIRGFHADHTKLISMIAAIK